ncbi:hypothetical protein J5N97_027214 [Dioscorea zingiberensis]|uniref:SHSP domain-containing protein n=1 Tax=Dioscorea zingiberensis TaxID=325984 RepID=A0A9D5H7E5_9LILI|nr:hypothetical protein J5N97_027214 [Dioscorea zingiberensis]
MAPRRALEIRLGEQDSQRWRMPLREDAFESFMARAGDTAHKVFADGSLFSPLLFRKFFDPADAFPLWEFDSEVLLKAVRSASNCSVDWQETDTEYVLRAELPSGRKSEIEISGEKGKVVEISGQWSGRESETMNWKASRWWEHGYVRRIELPEDANWKKMEAYIDDDNLLEIKIPKNNSDSNALQNNGVEPKESEYV